MKHRKYLLAITLASICTGYAYADSDITDMLFANTKQDDVIFEIKVENMQEKTQEIDSKTKQDVDIFVQKAIEKARVEEENKRLEKIKKEQENKKQEELRKKEQEKKKQEELRKKEQEKKKQEELRKKEQELKEQKRKEEEKKAIDESEKEKNIQASASDMTNYAKTLLGVPYVWGGTSSSGFDCSGFVQKVYNKFDINLKRTTYDQITQGTSVKLENIKENDLVFFDTRAAYNLAKKNNITSVDSLSDVIINESEKNLKVLYPTEPTHVGIYIGDGKIIHASSSKKQTVIDTLDNGYFKERIVDIRRYK